MDILLQLRDFLWGPFTILFMLGTGVYMTFRTGFVQFWCFPALIRQLRRVKPSGVRGISPLQALCTSLGGELGIGNLSGVAVAMTLGGPGAIFYMMLAAFFGMATKFSEIVLAVRFQVHTRDGHPLGGPMVYLSRGMGWHRTAKLFCVFCVVTSIVMGAMTQMGAMIESVSAILPLPPVVIACAAAAITAPVLRRGKTFIAAISCVLVPMLMVLYLAGCTAELALHWQAIPDAFTAIWQSAARPAAAGGGMMGFLTSRAVVNGFSKGVFTNEAGLGSAPIAHGCAANESAFDEGVLGAVEVFVDTCVICLLTALVILTSGAMASGQTGLALTTLAFSDVLGGWAPLFICVTISFLAIASVFGWAFYGLTCLRYLTDRPRAAACYRWVLLAAIVLTAVFPANFLLIAADLFIAPMAFPNLLAVWTLAPVVEQETAQYLRTKKRRRKPAPLKERNLSSSSDGDGTD